MAVMSTYPAFSFGSSIRLLAPVLQCVHLTLRGRELSRIIAVPVMVIIA
jgi:hypothetical protein